LAGETIAGRENSGCLSGPIGSQTLGGKSNYGRCPRGIHQTSQKVLGQDFTVVGGPSVTVASIERRIGRIERYICRIEGYI